MEEEEHEKEEQEEKEREEEEQHQEEQEEEEQEGQRSQLLCSVQARSTHKPALPWRRYSSGAQIGASGRSSCLRSGHSRRTTAWKVLSWAICLRRGSCSASSLHSNGRRRRSSLIRIISTGRASVWRCTPGGREREP